MSFQRSLKKMLDDFDPNNSAPYATYAPTRGVPWKIHANRRSALNAFSQYDYVILYELVEQGVWSQLVRKCYLDHNEVCENCGGTTVVRGYAGDVDGGLFGWARDPVKKSKKAEPLQLKFVCRNCIANFL